MSDESEVSKLLEMIFKNLGFPQRSINEKENVNTKTDTTSNNIPDQEPINIDQFSATDIKGIVRDKLSSDEIERKNDIDQTALAVYRDIMQMIVTKQFKDAGSGSISISITGPQKRRMYVNHPELQDAINKLLKEKGLELTYMIILPLFLSNGMMEDYQLKIMS